MLTSGEITADTVADSQAHDKHHQAIQQDARDHDSWENESGVAQLLSHVNYCASALESNITACKLTCTISTK